MFFLTNGFLEQASQRGFVLETMVDQNSKIILKNFEYPVIVRVDEIIFHERDNLMFLMLYDGESSRKVNFDISKWQLLSEQCETENSKKIDVGTVIIIYEYTFQDLKISDHDHQKDMMTILECSVIGTTCKTLPNVPNVDTLTDTSKTSQVHTQKKFLIANITINLHNQMWNFNGKLTKKSPIKEFVNKFNGQNGQFMRLQFGDTSGLIEMVAFNEECDRIKNLVEDKFYTISNADVKQSKGQTHAWEDTKDTKLELVATKQTIYEDYEQTEKYYKIFEMQEATEVPPSKKAKHMLTLNDLNIKKDGDFITTIAIVNLIEDYKQIIPKSKNPINLRNFYLSDKTTENIKVAVWGKQAEEFSFKVGDILLLSKIKLTRFNGTIALSVQWETGIMKIEDDWNHIEEANELRDWWKQKDNGLSNCLKKKLSITNS
jgi:hypothetical protein